MWWLVAPVLAQTWTVLAEGVDYAAWSTADPMAVSALRVDLCTRGVRVRATTSAERGQRTSSWAAGVEGVVAPVNGGFFLSGYVPDGGRATGNGTEWPDSTDTDYRGFLAFREHQLAHSGAGDVAALDAWAEEAVNGDATLVQAGTAVDCGGCGSGRQPRTAAGFSQDQQTL